MPNIKMQKKKYNTMKNMLTWITPKIEERTTTNSENELVMEGMMKRNENGRIYEKRGERNAGEK